MPAGTYDPLQLHTLAEVSKLTRLSRKTLHRDIAAGRLRVVKLGSSTRIPRVELERYITSNGGGE